ncbi:hypothetical protein BJ508DRAFT_91724 [Ascobolus immersus RN42]|uniref:Uncharacterized protein n=1 Tax=Ascobolus immersus RN42 TaxID=1160509 RepID=A0A3N4HA80_ASCIM|nr:hypothetical protein BJ508DRAFT_91724 [Ascobolus immersus RN42]
MDSASAHTPPYKAQPNFCFKLVESATPEQLAEARKQLLLRGLATNSSPIGTTQTASSTTTSLSQQHHHQSHHHIHSQTHSHSLSQSPTPSTPIAPTSTVLLSRSLPPTHPSPPTSQAHPNSHTPTTSPTLPTQTPHLSPTSLKRLHDSNPHLSPTTTTTSSQFTDPTAFLFPTPDLKRPAPDDPSTTPSFPPGRPRKKPRTPTTTPPSIPISQPYTAPTILSPHKLLEDAQKLLMERQARLLRLESENKRLLETHRTEMERMRNSYERRLHMAKEAHDEEVAGLNAKISLLEEVGLQKEVAYREKEKLADDLKEVVEGLRSERSGKGEEGWKERFLESEKEGDALRERLARVEARAAVVGGRVGGVLERWRGEVERLGRGVEEEVRGLIGES